MGWVFQYALVDTHRPATRSADLRSLQDWYLRYQLQAVPGVAEVAPLGGFVRQYQVNVDPNRLAAYGVPISKVVAAVRGGNNDVGGRLVEFAGREYMVRGRGYAQLHRRPGADRARRRAHGRPRSWCATWARVTLGPDIRRGVADLDGQGEVVVRHRRHAPGRERAARHRPRQSQAEGDRAGACPPGVEVVTTYDRSELIQASIDNLKHTLIEELVVVALVILIFLWHIPSAVIPILTIPVAVLIAFIPMRLMGMSSNIMSLGGIAIAMGAMVDAAIVVVEQTHKKLEHADHNWTPRDYQHAIVSAVKEVGGPSFFALLVIAVSFLPVFTLEDQEGRLFKPLAYTKNFAMIVAAVLAITLDPALRLLFFRKQNFRVRPRWLSMAGERNPRRQDPFRRQAPHQPRIDAALRAGREVEPALEMAHHRGRRRARGAHRARLPEAGLRIHAAAG